MLKKFQISVSNTIWQLENGTCYWTRLDYLVSQAHKNKIPNTYVVGVDLFNGDIIHITRCRCHTGNKYG